MTATYPGAIKSWTPLTPNVTPAQAAQVNTIYEEVTAVQTELGANVAGSATDLVTRLARSISAAGLVNFEAPSTLTIASGAITLTKNLHILDTESAAATDDLDTITAGADGQLVILTIASSARNVVIRHNVGNILTPGAGNITLDLTSDIAMGIYSATLSKWVIFGVFFGLGTNNTWTGSQYFNGGIRNKQTTVTSNTTLDSTYNEVLVDATSGAITITLPLAASGGRFEICKIDASANAVTVDGNGAETINNAATYVLSNRYSNVTVSSTGTEYIIK